MSWPARSASGPREPQPDSRPTTRRGLLARSSAGARPRRSSTPGRKPSSSTSAASISERACASPSADFMSIATGRLPTFETSNFGSDDTPRPGSAGGEIRVTSAPRPRSSCPANGTGPIAWSSMIFRPASGRAAVSVMAGRRAGGGPEAG